jgi:hypothetical protein
LALYAGLVVVNLVIAFCAWFLFGKRSVRLSIILYLVWLTLFVWHRWWTDYAPFQLNSDYYPMDPNEFLARFQQVLLIAAFYICAYALFPILCYSDKRHIALPSTPAALV